jgi:hypothetical protein
MIRIHPDHQIGIADCACRGCTPTPDAILVFCPRCRLATRMDREELETSICAQCALGGRGEFRFSRVAPSGSKTEADHHG